MYICEKISVKDKFIILWNIAKKSIRGGGISLFFKEGYGNFISWKACTDYLRKTYNLWKKC